MKNTVLFLFIGFWVVALGALAINKFSNHPAATVQNQIVNNTPAISTPANNSTDTTTPAAKTYTMAQVASHNSSSSCWLAISGSAYDVTKYLGLHPGGAGEILRYCGKDATTAFATMGGRGAHSSYAHSLLGDYLLGKISG